jgi:uncharacterized membrane protein (Fun14 family)
VILSTIIAVISRVVDREEGGRWVFWKKSYLPDGFNYILEAINLHSGGNRASFLDKLEKMFPDNSQLMFDQSIAVTDTLDSRPVYPLITSFFLDVNFEIAPLVGPIIGWFLLNILIYHHIRKFHGTIYALIVVVIFSSSYYMRFNFIGTTTDALSALFTYLVFHYLLQENLNLARNVLLNIFLLLAILTRPLDPIFLMLFIGIALFNFRNHRLISKLIFPITLLIAHLIYIQIKYQQLEVGSLNTGGDREASFLEYLVEAALKVPKLIIVEFGFLTVNDSLFCLLIVWTFFLLWFKGSKILIIQFTTVFLSSFYLAALNGPIGNGFRYQLPIVMFCLIVIRVSDPPKIVWKSYKSFISDRR